MLIIFLAFSIPHRLRLLELTNETTSCPVKFEFWINEYFFLVEIFPKYWKGQTCTQKVFAVYLKFGCEEASCIYLATSLETLLPAGSVAKNHLLVQEMWVRTLGEEDALEEELAAHSSIAAWRNPWTEEPGGLQSMGLPRVRHN